MFLYQTNNNFKKYNLSDIIIHHQYSIPTILQVVFDSCAGWYRLNSSPLQYRSALIATRMGKNVFINLCLAYG